MADVAWSEPPRSEDWDPEPDRVGCLALLAGIVVVIALCAGGIGYLAEGSWTGFLIGVAWIIVPAIVFTALLGGMLLLIYFARP